MLRTTNPHWARVVGYGPFSFWVIHKEGLCLRSLMMMMIKIRNNNSIFLKSNEASVITLINRIGTNRAMNSA
jgi:hypothetical protein